VRQYFIFKHSFTNSLRGFAGTLRGGILCLTKSPRERHVPTMRHLIALLFVLALTPLTAARAETPIFSEDDGIAIRGYDVVSYFQAGRPIEGRTDIAVMWKGVVWRFSNDSNREMFESNPRAYAPRFGGYCAYAVSNGYLMSGDPTAWEIVDGQLYLTFNPVVHEIWNQDQAGHISQAQGHWPAVVRD
jgi:YHS domain-containing protein